MGKGLRARKPYNDEYEITKNGELNGYGEGTGHI